MSDTVLIALITQVTTLVTVIVIAIFGRKKLDKIDHLVNGHSEAQMEKIERQTALIQALLSGKVQKRADDPALGGGIKIPPIKER